MTVARAWFSSKTASVEKSALCMWRAVDDLVRLFRMAMQNALELLCDEGVLRPCFAGLQLRWN